MEILIDAIKWGVYEKRGAMEKEMKILVAGDLLYDYNLLEYSTGAARYHEAFPCVAPSQRRGGAWYLEELIFEAVKSTSIDTNVSGMLREDDDCDKSQNKYENIVGRTHQIWSLKDAGEKKKVWRIEKYLGCHKANSDEIARLLEKRNWGDGLPEVDMLVLDDLSLGFSKNPKLWPPFLREKYIELKAKSQSVKEPGVDESSESEVGKKSAIPQSIVLKLSTANLDNPLWETLKEFADRLTVVLSIDTLREQNAAVSKGLSWDRTIEEIDREIAYGVSAHNFGLCRRLVVLFGKSGIASFSRLKTRFGKVKEDIGRLYFEIFLYDPQSHEGTWIDQRPGLVFGSLSILTAAIARHEIETKTYPLYIAVGRALSAIRANHEKGGGNSKSRLDTDASRNDILSRLNWKSKTNDEEEPAKAFYTSYPQYSEGSSYGLLSDKELENRSNLLHDVTGEGLEYVAAKAMEIVINGPEKALKEVPKAKYGSYMTADREEIERINSLYNMIKAYRENPDTNRPLSIAVFGPPGAGKSFAIEQLAETILGKQDPMVFNLSQFDKLEKLHGAFHQIHDKSIQGEVPLVFWDEFDSNNLQWLKEFLVPMQDSEFRDENASHPIGKCIFVFAGGVYSTFEDFDKTDISYEFKEKKGPDFVSRLRGYMNIKGPNQTHEKDVAYMIRRAILLRVALIKNCKQAISDEGMASISTSVAEAFLRVHKYKHGARSLMSIVSLSQPGDAGYLNVSALPPQDVINLHASNDFMVYVQKQRLTSEAIELLAKSCHMAWKAEKENQGYAYGKKRIEVSLSIIEEEHQDWLKNCIRNAEASQELLKAISEEIKSILPEESRPKSALTQDNTLVKEVEGKNGKWLIETKGMDKKQRYLIEAEQDNLKIYLRKHHLLKNYSDLSESEKEENRHPARLTRATLDELGYQIKQFAGKTETDIEAKNHKVIENIKMELADLKHDIWLREYLVAGYEHADKTNDDLFLHKAIDLFASVDEEDRELDLAIAEDIPRALADGGYVLEHRLK